MCDLMWSDPDGISFNYTKKSRVGTYPLEEQAICLVATWWTNSIGRITLSWFAERINWWWRVTEWCLMINWWLFGPRRIIVTGINSLIEFLGVVTWLLYWNLTKIFRNSTRYSRQRHKRTEGFPLKNLCRTIFYEDDIVEIYTTRLRNIFIFL